jgi:hypothetical protein
VESSQVINHLVRTLGVAVHEATAFAETVHEIVEEQVTDDVSVIAPPLILGRFGCPVLDRLFMRLEDPRWSLPESVDVPPEELAATLRLPVEVIEAYPVVGRFGLLAKILDRLAVADEDAESYLRMLDTWLATYAEGSGRDFEVLPTGSREAFRGWLLDRFDLLGRFGYPVRVADESDDRVDGRAHSFDDGRRPDLIARVTADGDAVRRGDWLVIQHKATAVGHTAHDELAAHVDWLRAELGTKLGTGEVHGLLIADGASLLLERALRERGFGYVSLSALGYRHWVRSHTRVAVVGDPDTTAIAYPATIRLGSLSPVAG